MRYLFLLGLLLFSLSSVAKSGNEVDSTKVTIKFGGRIDVVSYLDTYNSVESRNGVQYLFPRAPQYNKYGEDLNFETKFRFSVAPTRLNFAVNVPKIGTAKGKAYVEVDFMGANESVLGAIRLRHAYFALDWKNQSLLFGQTSHLVMIDDIAPNIVTFGGGYPLNTLNRPIQIRFTQRFGKGASFDAAVSMLAGADYQMQARAVAPDLQVRFNFESGSSKFGIAGGAKILKPRSLTADSARAKQNLLCFDVAAYYKGNFNNHNVTLYAIWAQDGDALSIMGGYAPRNIDIENGIDDYRYVPTAAVSVWADYQTPKFKGFYAGCFAGWQKNLGTQYWVDLSKAKIDNYGIDSFFRVSPKVMYDYKMLTFGLEYMLTGAWWGKEFNMYYLPTKMYQPTFNHRVTLLARFRF